MIAWQRRSSLHAIERHEPVQLLCNATTPAVETVASSFTVLSEGCRIAAAGSSPIPCSAAAACLRMGAGTLLQLPALSQTSRLDTGLA